MQLRLPSLPSLPTVPVPSVLQRGSDGLQTACVFTRDELRARVEASAEAKRLSESKAPTALRVMTFNCYTHVQSPFDKLQRMQEFLEAHADAYDVLILQELFAIKVMGLSVNNVKQYVVEEAAKRGFVFHARTPTRLMGQGSGLCVLSRFPITSVEYVHFRETDELLSSKGALKATIYVSGLELVVVDTHLEGRFPLNRVKQVREIREALEDDYEYMVFAGDFNSTPGSEALTVLQACWPRLRNVFEPHDSPVTTRHGHPEKDVAIDHIFVSRSLETSDARVVDTGPVSDHNAVAVTVHLPPLAGDFLPPDAIDEEKLARSKKNKKSGTFASRVCRLPDFF